MLRNRKLLLYVALGITVLLFAGDWIVQQALRGPLHERAERQRRLEDRIADREKKLAAVRRSAAQRELWEAASLPANGEVARSLYQAWLIDVVNRVGLANPNVDSNEPSSRRGLYTLLTFSLRGRGSLAQFTELLYEFYSAPHLHQIRSVSMTPTAASGLLDISLNIEAISLPTADREDRLSEAEQYVLAFPALQDYSLVAERDWFGMGGAADVADQTYLTAVTSVDQEPRAWFTLRTTDQVMQQAEGDSFSIGRLQLKIVSIDQTDVLLAASGEYWLVSVGESLSEATAIPAELVEALIDRPAQATPPEP